MEISCRVYKPRRPRESPLYRLVEQQLEELLRVWPTRCARQHGPLRPVVERVLREFLKCGLLEHGFARLWCGECRKSVLVAFSCRGRSFCPSCEKKKQLLWAEWLRDEVLLDVAHRHVVLTIPRLLRPLLRRRRELLGELARAGAEAVKEFVRHTSDEGDARPGIVVSVATAGDLLQWHPHLHLITTDGGRSADGSWHTPAEWDAERLMRLFRERLLTSLLDKRAISQELVQKLLAWRHPGFSAHVGDRVAAEDKQRLEDAAAYLVRNPLSLKKLVYLDGQQAVLYRSRMNPSLGRNFEALDPLEGLARISDHIPDPGQVGLVHALLRPVLVLTVLAWAASVCRAQDTTLSSDRQSAAAPERSIEDLNLIGAAVTMPAFADTVLGADSGFRRALFRHGMLLRVNIVPRFSQNLLDAPAPSGQQVYIGHSPTFISGVNPIFTWDLRQIGLRQAQLHAAVGWRYSSWQPAGPNTIAMTSLHVFKRWGDRRVEMKAGYLGNDLEFVGLQVGGSTSTGAQGVYAVLPNEVGMSYFPLTAPSLNLRLRARGYGYFKTAAQRSLDAAGARSTVDRNPSGFRFRPDGNGLLLINEIGYQRPSTAAAPQAWFRAGYMRNGTRYTNRATGEPESGNYCAYVLMDYQLRMPDPASPARGLFLGGTAMTVPSELNPYDRYYEARLYQRVTFASRPTDVLSLIASYRGHSHSFTDRLAAEGRSVLRGSSSLTGTYTLHAARGNYLSLSLGYVRGPALTPRVADTLTFTLNWGLYL